MWGAVIQGAVALTQMGIGMSQQKKAEDAKRNALKARPSYSAPDAAKRALKVKEQAAAAGMPGYNQALEQLQVNKANTMRRVREGARSSADIGNIASAVQGSSDDAITNLNVQNAMFRERARESMTNELGNMAGYEDKAWQWNQQDPYLREYSEANQQHNTGMQTMFKGMDLLGAAGVLGGPPSGGGQAPQVGGMGIDAQAGMASATDAVSNMAQQPQGGQAANMAQMPQNMSNPWAQAFQTAQVPQVASSVNPYGSPYGVQGVQGLGYGRGPGMSGINPFGAAGQALNIQPFQ